MLERPRQTQGWSELEGGGVPINRVGGEGLTEMTFEKYLKVVRDRGKQMCREELPGQRNSMCKGPEAENT